MVITVGEALELSNSLGSVSETPHLDVELLLSQVLGKDRAYLFAHPEKLLQPPQESELLQMISRCRQGEPIAYITGRKEFWSIEIKVSPDVLIPRPETELLIDLALSLFPDQPLEVADLGTGSGAIAVALASERQGWNILATDISLPALLQARVNIEAIFAGKSNIRLLLADWCQPFCSRSLDLIVSNPPYIRSEEVV